MATFYSGRANKGDCSETLVSARGIFWHKYVSGNFSNTANILWQAHLGDTHSIKMPRRKQACIRVELNGPLLGGSGKEP